MAKMESTFTNMLLVLTGITVVAASVLASVYSFTKKPIELAKKAKQENAVKAVVPEYDNDPVAEAYKVIVFDNANDSLKIFPAKKGGDLVGVAVETYSDKGFGGIMNIMVGFDKEGAITNYSVLDHKETPGLGAKMGEWFLTDKNKQSVIGKVPGDGLKVSKDGGEIDAITAATISSRAFMDALNRAYKSYKNENDGTTGATGSSN